MDSQKIKFWNGTSSQNDSKIKDEWRIRKRFLLSISRIFNPFYKIFILQLNLHLDIFVLKIILYNVTKNTSLRYIPVWQVLEHNPFMTRFFCLSVQEHNSKPQKCINSRDQLKYLTFYVLWPWCTSFLMNMSILFTLEE